MRPIRIYLKNFMNHRETEIDVNFQSVLIVGRSSKNERISNGVGKTTLFRAIEYVLFNQSHATVLDKIIRDGKHKAIVEFDFELGGEIYRIYRHRCDTGAADVRLYQKIGGVFESISGRTPTHTDVAIHNLIKISHKAFTYSVLFRQADLAGITATDPNKTDESNRKARKDILKEPLNLSTYTKLESLAAKKVTPIKKEIDRLEGSVSVIGLPDVDIKKAEEDLVSTLDQISTNKSGIVILNSTVDIKRRLVDDLKQSLGQQDIDIHRKIAEQESALKKLKEAAKINDKRMDSLSSVIVTKEGRLKKNKDEEIQTQEKLSKLISECEGDIDDLQQKYDSVCADEMNGSGLIAEARGKIKFIKKSIPDNDECQTCHQSITTEYRQSIANNVNAKLKKQEEEIEFFEDALGKCRRKKARIDLQLKAARNCVNEISKAETLIKTLGNEQKSLREEIDRLYVDQGDAAKKIQEEELQIVETTASLEILRKAAEKSSALTINNKIFSLNQDISDLQEEIINYNRRISNLISLQGGLEERISTRKADKEKLKNLEDSLVKFKSELRIRQMVVEAFGNKGIPNFIIQNIIEDLQFEANSALKELRPELDVKIDSELNFEYRRNGVIRDYYQLSHGQMVYIALAFKRGLSKVLQKRLNITINQLFFDEVDAHLDDEGIEAFSNAILKWKKDFTIFVITHNKDLKDKFSHAIVVEEGDDGASASVVSSW